MQHHLQIYLTGAEEGEVHFHLLYGLACCFVVVAGVLLNGPTLMVGVC